jgi:WS/DGAT/MGAT family acyltransferase
MDASSVRMSPVDRAWLSMERRTNPMMVVALVVLSKRLSLSALRRIVAERFLAFDRFRLRPVNEALSATWVQDPSFDVDAHVHGVALPRPGRQSQLQDLVADLASTPLPNDRPMWSLHLVDRYHSGSAVIIRIHHCYADGIALAGVMLSLTDGGAAPPAREEHGAGGVLDSLASLYQPVGKFIEQGLHYALHPGEVVGAAADVAGLAQEFAHVATLPTDTPTLLKGPLSGSKRVAWARPLPLDEVRTLAKALGCTINDVVMSTLAGALGCYLRARGRLARQLVVRAAVPVNLRSPEQPFSALGNQFGLVFMELPIGEQRPLQRLYQVHDAMKALRESRQPLVAYGLLAALGRLPLQVEEPAIELFSSKASLVVSNVPGPREPLSMAGAPISQLLFWVPQSGSIGIGVSILTYADKLQFGVIADRELIEDPGELTDLFAPEFENLLLLALLSLAPDR